MRTRACVFLSATTAIAGIAMAGPAAAATKRAGSGTLVVRVDGLPKGFAVQGVLRGPKRFSRSVRRTSQSYRRLAPGRYTLRLASSRAKRADDLRKIAKGAIATPQRKRYTIRVTKRGRTRLLAGYGAVVNPNAHAVPKGPLQVEGPPEQPSGLVVPTVKGRYRVGGFLTAGPSTQLPLGLVSRITAVRPRGKQTFVGLQTVDVTDVMPRLSLPPRTRVKFAKPQQQAATSRAAIAPGGGSVTLETGKFKQDCLTGKTNIGFETKNSFDADVEVSALTAFPPRFAFDADFGLTSATSMTFDGSLSCSVDIPFGPRLPFVLPTPVPIPGSVGVTFVPKAEVKGKISLNMPEQRFGMIARVDTSKALAQKVRLQGYRRGGLPMNADGEGSGSVGAELKADLSLGIHDVAEVKAEVGAGFSANYEPFGDGCFLNFSFGDVNVVAQLGPLNLTIPAYRKLVDAPFFKNPGCRRDKLDPIIGTWGRTDEESSVEITGTTDPKQFSANYAPTKFNDKCTVPGGNLTLTRADDGSYTTSGRSNLYDDDKCVLKETAIGPARITVSGDSMESCSTYPTGGRRCGSYRRTKGTMQASRPVANPAPPQTAWDLSPNAPPLDQQVGTPPKNPSLDDDPAARPPAPTPPPLPRPETAPPGVPAVQPTAGVGGGGRSVTVVVTCPKKDDPATPAVDESKKPCAGRVSVEPGGPPVKQDYTLAPGAKATLRLKLAKGRTVARRTTTARVTITPAGGKPYQGRLPLTRR